MKLIVGLGNPGRQYENTRHNMGFRVLDLLAETCQADFDHEKFKGVFAIVKNPNFDETFLLAKPETFMNLSGEFIRPLMDYFKIQKEDLVVVYDDMALPVGTIRLRPFGSSGSHNGMKSIIQNLGSDQFKRIRIGIGEPPHSGVDWVLTKPSKEEEPLVEEALEKAKKALLDYLRHDWQYAMNHNN